MKQLKPLDLEELNLVSGGCDNPDNPDDINCDNDDEEEGSVIK